MTFTAKNAIKGMSSFLGSFFPRKKEPARSPVEQIHTKRKLSLSPEKQAEMDLLCKQLFKKKELITSGKLQFIGLTKIKRRMGKQWAGLCKIVYDTAEDVINKYLDKGDIFIRFQDDTYVMIFAHSSPEEGRRKANIIAEEIRQRLFALDEKELRDLEIKKAISEIRTDMLADLDLPDMMDVMFQDSEEEVLEEEDDEPFEIESIEVGTKYDRTVSNADDQDHTRIKLQYAYTPLWNTQKGALTTYLCLARGEGSTGKNSFDAYAGLFRKRDVASKNFLDQKVLDIVAHELENMERDGRKLFVVCPVQHETLYHFEQYEKYKQRLLQIPASQRQFLILLVMDMNEELTKDPYWFATPLRQLCRHVFAEIPLRRDINFNYLRNSGVDVVGVRLDKSIPEQQIITVLNSFTAKAKALKIPQTFVLDLSTLSLTTSAVCAGFNYLGGTAIHEEVSKPDSVHRYRHEDLLSDLIRG